MRRDEAVMVPDGQLQTLAHVIVARPEEGVADPGVVDQQPAEARLQIDVAGHLADDLVEAIVFEHHRERVASDACGAEPLLCVLEARQAASA